MKKVFAVVTTWYLALWSLFVNPSQTYTHIVLTKLECENPNIKWTKTLAKAYAVSLMKKEYPHWNKSEHRALMKLWGKESAWDATAQNPESSAFGIPQILGMHPNTPAPRQIERGLEYIQHRYTKPSVAWSHWRNNNWY